MAKKGRKNDKKNCKTYLFDQKISLIAVLFSTPSSVNYFLKNCSTIAKQSLFPQLESSSFSSVNHFRKNCSTIAKQSFFPQLELASFVFCSCRNLVEMPISSDPSLLNEKNGKTCQYARNMKGVQQKRVEKMTKKIVKLTFPTRKSL